MALSVNDETKMKQLQDNLSCLRKLAGWTAEEFGDQLGITKQTVLNLEKGRTPVNRIQYIAIRAIFEKRAAEMEDNRILSDALERLVDTDWSEASEDNVKTVKDGYENITNMLKGKRMDDEQSIVMAKSLQDKFIDPIIDSIKISKVTLEINEEEKKALAAAAATVGKAGIMATGALVMPAVALATGALGALSWLTLKDKKK